MTSITTLLRSAVRQLEDAGVDSPAADARHLLAHVLGLPPSRLLLVDEVGRDDERSFAALIDRRTTREPLQHLTGTAHFRYLELAVGPGVFVPRPETEAMTGWAVDRLRELQSEDRQPSVVELCAGSGAISKAIATEVPGVQVRAVEISEEASSWAVRNLAGTSVELHTLDMVAVPADWDQTVDLVIANPPYIPLEAFESVAPEARDHDPAIALYSGNDGLDAIRTVAKVAGRLLRDGGLVCAEHAEAQEQSAPQVFLDAGTFTAVRDHRDLNCRPRFVTATRVHRAGR
jgi:release factor glutamine methyltransferase